MGSLLEDKKYNDELSNALQVLKIFKNLSYEDKLMVIKKTEELLITQENDKFLINTAKQKN